MAGNNPSGSPPERVNSSVWHTPVAFSSTSTSPAFGPSRSRVTISSGLPAAVAIAARVFMAQLPASNSKMTAQGAAPPRARGWPLNAGGRSGGERALGFRRVGRDQVHQRRRQAVVRLELQLLQPRAHLAHLRRRETGLDDRGYEGGEHRLFPARVLRQLGVEEVEAVEG